jgi:adenylate cyclase
VAIWTFPIEGRAYATLTLEEGDRLAVEWALKALEVDGNDEDAHALLGLVTATAHLEAGQEHVSLALTNSPNSPWANWTRASILTFGGHPAEGREALLNVLRLSPRDPHSAEYICQVSLSYYFERDYTNATLVARRAVSRYPDYPLTYRWLAASLGQLGQIAEAHAVLERAMAISQASLDFYTRSRPPWFRSEDYEHMLDGLRKAGWQG